MIINGFAGHKATCPACGWMADAEVTEDNVAAMRVVYKCMKCGTHTIATTAKENILPDWARR